MPLAPITLLDIILHVPFHGGPIVSLQMGMMR